MKSAEFRDKQARVSTECCASTWRPQGCCRVLVAASRRAWHLRGICDYSDEQNNEDWQAYAAATAAAYVKLLLSVVPATTRRPAQQEWEEPSRKRMRTEA